MIGITINSRDVAARTAKLTDEMPNAVIKGILDIAYEIMRLSQMEVPHDVGSLQNSGAVEPPDTANNSVVIGYHTPYAARLHEHPEYRFQKGRKGKYLEGPIIRNQNVLGIKLVDQVTKTLKGAIQ